MRYDTKLSVQFIREFGVASQKRVSEVPLICGLVLTVDADALGRVLQVTERFR